MIYAVVGHTRSGTSALMGALERGGLPLATTPKRDEFINEMQDGDYQINPFRLFELSNVDLRHRDFPSKYDGMAVKIVWQWVPAMRPHWLPCEHGCWKPGYRVAFLLRHPEEVRRSETSALKKDQAYRVLSSQEAHEWWRGYGSASRAILSYLRDRKDIVDLTVINYRKLIENPKYELARLNWPIDIESAASNIDPKEYRYRLENLQVGL